MYKSLWNCWWTWQDNWYDGSGRNLRSGGSGKNHSEILDEPDRISDMTDLERNWDGMASRDSLNFENHLLFSRENFVYVMFF